MSSAASPRRKSTLFLAEELIRSLQNGQLVGTSRSCEADRAWSVLDWLSENNPAALELCPYKAKR